MRTKRAAFVLNRLPISIPSTNSQVPQFQRELIALVPFLRALARGLCGKHGIADDMVQETLARAWRARESFKPGSNMKGWLFTILRNQISSHGRRAWRQTAWDEFLGQQIAAPPLEQEWAMHLSDIARAVANLPYRQREALILVAVGGYTYEQAATLSGLSAVIMKSRVARARAKLLDIVDGNRPLPQRRTQRATETHNQILAQLSALAQSYPHGGAAHV
jgi:RNA polymerase sigma-70 factor (ECF subfamily)